MDSTQHVLSTDSRMEGTRIGDQVVLFGVDGTVDLTNSVSYSPGGTTALQNLLVDLQAGGTYKVVVDGTTLTSVAASSQGTISFTTPAGAKTVTVTRVA